MKKKIFFLFLSFWQTTLIYSQTTDFKVKKFIIGYGFNISPASLNSTKNNMKMIGTRGSAQFGKIVFNNLHEVFFEYLNSEKWVIGANIKYYKTAYDNQIMVNNLGKNIYHLHNEGYPNGSYLITGISYSIYAKYYRKNFDTKKRKYIMFGPVINQVFTSYDKNSMNIKAIVSSTLTNTQTDTLITDFGAEKQNFRNFNFMVGFGRTWIIAEKIVLDFGFTSQIFSLISLPLDLEDTSAISDIDINQDKLTTSSYIEKTYKKRIRGINRFNTFIKIGYFF